MTTVRASAPGKIILLGEHAVVYGQPALAVPVHALRATTEIAQAPPGAGLTLNAPDLGVHAPLTTLAGHPLAQTVELVLATVGVPQPDATVRITSTIPIAAGLGSGAAVTASLASALSTYLGQPIEGDTLSALVYEVEKHYHGTPSGIDNTVVCAGRPVFFRRSQPIETFTPGAPFHFVVADTGVPSHTHQTVSAVREGWLADPARYDALFERIGTLVLQGRTCIEAGDAHAFGPLMSANHALLRELGVSSTELDALVAAAGAAGALGAKLSGGGGGGNMIALAGSRADADRIRQALVDAGTTRAFITTLNPPEAA